MNKICTDIEQSEKLMELGIDVNTADMYYTSEHSTPSIMTGAKSDYSSYIPAWSLSALLEMLSFPDLFKNDGWNLYITKPISINNADNPVDACYEMIVKLKESNLL